MSSERVGRLYTAYAPAIYARCLRLLGTPHAAEDATQETFLKVQKHLADAPDDPKAFAWVYRIATNFCLTQIRDRKPQVELADDSSWAENIEELMANRDLARRIVLHAPEKYRLAAWLHFVEGLTLEEAAEVLGITSRTVTNRLAAFLEDARAFTNGSPR